MGMIWRKKNKKEKSKEKKNKKEKKEKQRKKSDTAEAEDGIEMPSPDEPKNGADAGNGEMGETDPLMEQADALAPEDIEEIALRGRHLKKSEMVTVISHQTRPCCD